MKKSGSPDKYALARLAIGRVRDLVKEKDKRALESSKQKLSTYVLQELAEGKIKLINLTVEKEKGNKSG